MSLRRHLVRWEEEYANDGLVVIEINQSIGAPLDVMRRMVEGKELNHPVLWDAECRNTKAYGVSSWPLAYLIGTDGNVFWEGNPSRWIRNDEKIQEMRDRIEKELARASDSGKKQHALSLHHDVSQE